MKEIDIPWIKECQAGDVSAFDKLVELHRDQIYQLAYHITGSHEDADDISHGLCTSWSNFLESALDSLIECDIDGVSRWLEHFIDKVEQAIFTDRIPSIHGDELIARAQDIIDRLPDSDASGPAVELTNPGYIPSELCLHSCYPNPFNSSTTISYQLQSSMRVRLDIIDIQGRRIAKLVDSNIQAGNHQINWNAAGVPSGIYFCRLQAGETIKYHKLVLVR